ncbi:Putative glycosyltransferase EpsH [Rhodobacteraceae bacterium THAF1]|uniref:glycosyltransferase family 2 protein n=1 Tax=Palleronia sp. THAF1 TaxID=2587842 RepID=UPI000F3EFAFB|nr:glycosyltransferase family 2 protein [Palleronia sp. THAF1]QFU10354.1 Putative glycosyltransferase EpsH [Palleronia sp. THAF1]VDC31473.1 Putative glycosyltransferase EpsH [Rhodobacteraceae bacterium THAF1]
MPHNEQTGHAGISVILATYERSGFIAAAIQSILDQTQELREIIVVDDGSKDETADVVATFGDRVTYLRQENAGKLAAIARGLDHATGDFVWIMDDDDLATPDAMEALLEPLAADPRCVMSYGRMSRFEDGEEDTGSDSDVPYPPPDDRSFLVRLMEDCFITGHPCVLVRRAALEDMRPFRRDILASVDYYLHLGVATQGKTVFVDRLVLRQRQHRGSRGPSALRYGENDRNARWIMHDKMLIGPLLQSLPLGAYIYHSGDARYGSPLTDPSEKRRALFQKATIAARKKLWPVALDALDEGAALMPSTSLTAEERRIISKALGCRYGIDEVHDDPDLVRRLRGIAQHRDDPSDLLVPLSRPLLHELKIARREKDGLRARKALATWKTLMPWRSSVAALREIFDRNAKRLARH